MDQTGGRFIKKGILKYKKDLRLGIEDSSSVFCHSKYEGEILWEFNNQSETERCQENLGGFFFFFFFLGFLSLGSGKGEEEAQRMKLWGQPH